MERSRALRTAVSLMAGFGCVVLAACGVVPPLASSSDPTPSPTFLPGGRTDPAVRYMPLGDSITDGFTVPGGFRTPLWLHLVKKDSDKIDFVGSRSTGPAELGDKDNEGHPGWCIDGPCGGNSDELIYPRVHEWMTTYKPDIVSIHLGTNDLKFGASGAVVAYGLDETIAQIYRDNPRAYVVVATIIPMRDVTKPWAEYNRLIPQIAQRYRAQGRQIQVVDLASALRQPRDFADPLHPDAAGYQKMADVLYPALSQAYLATR
jgi:hypothetical protein